MVCVQVYIYVIYLIIQTLFWILFFGLKVDFVYFLVLLVFIGIIYLLCNYKYYTVANILIGISMLYGIGTDIYSLTHREFATAERKRIANSEKHLKSVKMP